MVVSGALEIIPNQWGDVAYAEPIFIYAEDLDSAFENGPDLLNPLHRKIFNESFLGNMPEMDWFVFPQESYPTNAFIGYVRVYHTGRMVRGWLDNSELLFVNKPRRYKMPIPHYDISLMSLAKEITVISVVHKIALVDNSLIVPVSSSIWKELHNTDSYDGYVLFWENYMHSLFPSPFGNKPEPKFDYVVFRCASQELRLLADSSCAGWNIHKLKGQEESVEFLDFGIDAIPPQKKEDTSDNEVICYDSTDKYRQPYAKIIYTPMGGMTRWKR